MSTYMRGFINEYIELQQATILEIGAHDKPTFVKEEAKIFFADVQPKEVLLTDAEKWTDQRNVKSIVDLDYLIESNDYSKYITDKFDAIIADNVFEHVSNPIKWLESMTALLNDDGYLFLGVPEFNKNFPISDRFRTLTTFSHLLTDYIRNVPDLDPEHSVEAGIYYDMTTISLPNVASEKINLERSLHDYRNPHFGVHCHTFSCDTFVNRIMKPILMLGVVDFKLLKCLPSENKYVFLVALQKGKEEISLTFEEFAGDIGEADPA